MKLSQIVLVTVLGGALAGSAVGQEEQQSPGYPSQQDQVFQPPQDRDYPTTPDYRDYPPPQSQYPPPPQEQYPNYPTATQESQQQYPQSQDPSYPITQQDRWPETPRSQYPNYPSTQQYPSYPSGQDQGYPPSSAQDQGYPAPPQDGNYPAQPEYPPSQYPQSQNPQAQYPQQYPSYPPQQDYPPQGGYYPPQPQGNYPPQQGTYAPPQAPIWFPQSVEWLGRYASSRTEFTLDHSMLVFASKWDRDNYDLQRVIAGVRGVSVHSFRFPGPVWCDPRAIAVVSQQYRDAGFQHLVSKQRRGHGDIGTELWLHMDHGAVTDIAVLFTGERQLNFVTVAGSISPLELLHLSGHFGIPKMDGGVVVPIPYSQREEYGRR